ncbi:MAG: hypothetical protein PHD54_06660 [Desulfuromonadaceae bacterium]|nr:hypothetical protein [Desulfuromonadaceae bacterium]
MPGFEFKRLNHLIIIYRVVQIILVMLLLFMAYHFQQLFVLIGKPGQFINSFIVAVISQMILLYPAYLLSRRDAKMEIESCALGVSVETLVAIRKKRLLSDLLKFCILIFFITFVAMAPDAKKSTGAPLVLSTCIFSFLLISLTYFHGFNFCAKKQIKQIN